MPIDTEAIGREGRVNLRVSGTQSAEAWGNHDLPVLATPALVGLFEQAAIEAVELFLDTTESTVGTKIEVEHLAATPVGENICVVATVTAVDGRSVTFTLSAADEHQVIAAGSHVRVAIDRARFLTRVADLRTKAGVQ